MAARRANPLTEKELRFCEEFAAEPNATLAYRRAYPKASYFVAASQASLLLKKPKVIEFLTVTRKEYAKRCAVTAMRVLKENAAIAFADYADLFQEADDGLPRPRAWSEIPVGTRKAIQSIKIKRKQRNEGTARDPDMWEVEEIEYKLNSKDAALDKLCKHLGITSESVADELVALLASGRTAGETSPDAKAKRGSPSPRRKPDSGD